MWTKERLITAKLPLKVVLMYDITYSTAAAGGIVIRRVCLLVRSFVGWFVTLAVISRKYVNKQVLIFVKFPTNAAETWTQAHKSVLRPPTHYLQLKYRNHSSRIRFYVF